MDPTEKKTSITLDLDPETRRTLDGVVASVPLANRHAVARVALRAGLELLVQNPARTTVLLQGQKVNIGRTEGGSR